MENTHTEEYQVYGQYVGGEAWHRDPVSDLEQARQEAWVCWNEPPVPAGRSGSELVRSMAAPGRREANAWVKLRRRHITVQTGSWHDLPVG